MVLLTHHVLLLAGVLSFGCGVVGVGSINWVALGLLCVTAAQMTLG